MKKTLLTSILLLIVSVTVKAQDYIPMVDNTIWTVRQSGFLGSEELFYGPGTDEIVNGETYRKISGVPMTPGDVYIREDVAERKVYRLNDNSQEELLYDFTLQVDDEIVLSNGNTYTVTSRDSLAVMTGRKRVRLHLVHYAGTLAMGSETWIEGVGSWQVPLKPSYELLSDPAYSLTCSSTNGNPVYNRGLANTGIPTECPENTMDTHSFIAESTKLYPNPAKTYTTITTNTGFTNASLSVFNSMGQQIKQVNSISGPAYTLYTEHLTAGIYFIQISQGARENSIRKVLVVN